MATKPRDLIVELHDRSLPVEVTSAELVHIVLRRPYGALTARLDKHGQLCLTAVDGDNRELKSVVLQVDNLLDAKRELDYSED